MRKSQRPAAEHPAQRPLGLFEVPDATPEAGRPDVEPTWGRGTGHQGGPETAEPPRPAA
jgi:hypothetical protein